MENSVEIKKLQMNRSPPISSVHGILQARILECVIPFSRGSSQPRGQTPVFCIADDFFKTEPQLTVAEKWGLLRQPGPRNRCRSSGSGWIWDCSSGLFSNHFNWPTSGRQFQEDSLLLREI